MEKITLDGERALQEFEASLEDFRTVEATARITADEAAAIKGETGMEFMKVVEERCIEIVEVCQKQIKTTEVMIEDLHAANKEMDKHSEETMNI